MLARVEALDHLADTDKEALLSALLAASLLVEQEGSIRFAHQLLQEYFAAQTLREALERGESADRFFPIWWQGEVWSETVVILGELLGGVEGANRVARWLAPVNPELALEAVTRSSAGLTLDDVTTETSRALSASAQAKIHDAHLEGRVAAYRVLELMRADSVPVLTW